MKCLVQQMKQIVATRHSNDHPWAGPWTFIWSASSWRTAAHSKKCSRMQPQSSSHYPPAQGKRLVGRNMFPPKICMTDSSKAWLQFIVEHSILLNNLSLLRCHGYLGSDKCRATEASDWSLLISAAYQHPRMSYRPRELIHCYYVSFNTPT